MSDDWTPRELRLNPDQLRDLGDLWRKYERCGLTFDQLLEHEARQREAAEAGRQELGRAGAGDINPANNRPQGERKGPESAADWVALRNGNALGVTSKALSPDRAAADMLYVADPVPRPVGFTLAQVRELAGWVNAMYPNFALGTQPSVLAPFLPLLNNKS